MKSSYRVMSPEERAETIAEYLLEVPLLAKLSTKDRLHLGHAFREKEVPRGCEVIIQGEIGHAFYIIRTGEASVLIRDSATNKQTEVARLRPGDYFGETALLNDKPRNATVRAATNLVLFVLDKDTFTHAFGKERLRVNFGKRGGISAEKTLPKVELLRRPSRANTKKDSHTKELIASAVENNVLFAALDDDQVERIVDVMWSLDVKQGTKLITQGEPGDNFYVVEQGIFDIYVDRKTAPKLVASRSTGESFGELALMYNSPRSATVIARTPCKVWAVERYMFRKILIRVSDDKLREYEGFLKHVKLLDSLLANERRAVAEALDELKFKEGDKIVKQGEHGDTFYLIRKGKAKVWKSDTLGAPAKLMCRLKAGDFFGERALVKNDVRAATVEVVDGPMECLCLDREAFCLMLGPLAELMHRKIDEEYDGKTYTREDLIAGTELDLKYKAREKRSKSYLNTSIKFKDLIKIGILGKGSFGSVELVKHKITKKTYALKSVSKAQIVNTGQQEHILSEKNVMAALDSPFLVKLFNTYKDNNFLYFLLEVVLGGELFTVLRARTVFDEKTARFYAASVIEAFEYMHSKDMIYRDLKPENLLLDSHGYLKITDFGFAKIVKDRTYTLCGTPDYLAPEVIAGAGHGKGVDWWTLGILIYEMLASYPPFYDEDPMKTYAKIMYGKVRYPKHFTRNAAELIRGFLQAKPSKRLGIIKARSTREQLWFAGFDWESLRDLSMTAPIIPKISSPEDLSNFESYDDEPTQDLNYEDDGSNV